MTSPPFAVAPRLSIMMFLQFFIWGSWYVSVGNFIGAVGWGEEATRGAVGWAYTVGPIAAIVSPVFLGVVADRLFATQRVLAVMHLLGGCAMLAVPRIAVGADSNPDLLVLVLGVHMLCYMPTLGLTNTLAFHHVTDPERQFPLIRVFGTLGWIAANLVVSGVLDADRDALQFWLTGGACITLAVYSTTLPHTPPPLRGQRVNVLELVGVDALSLLRDRSFLVFIGASFLICIPLAAYYQQAPIFADAVGFEDVAATMSLGQVAEVVFMVAMPWFFARLGVKWMIAVGMAAWVVRYVLFAGAADEQVRWLVIGGILLHGICYDFFFVTGQIYVDRAAPAGIRGQAQGLLVLITQGFGLGIGAQLVEWHVGRTTELGTRDWETFWVWPAVVAGVVLLGFVGLFRGRAAAAA